MKALIVTADDFGLADEVNEAVELAHTDGILTAASLMVGGRAAADALLRVRRLPSLGVGLHIVLVDGRPVLPPEKVPDLVDSCGNFRTGMFALGVEIYMRPRVRKQVAAEITAQFAAFAATGLPLDHVNAHKHFHLHPTVAGDIIDIGQRYGMRSLRVPIEPASVLARVDPNGQAASFRFTDWWATRLRKVARLKGLRTPDQVFGTAWSGAMTERRVTGLLRALPDGVTEIYMHPAVRDDFESAAVGYRYADELAALTAPVVRTLVRATGARTGGYSAIGVA